MIRLEKHTRMKAEQAISKAVEFFGPKGYGLEVNQSSPLGARFEGGGGMVEVTSRAEGKGATVEIVAQEWDIQAKEFMRKIR
jgi:hypothetical protein